MARRVSGGKVSDVERQWWESQWRGESVVEKSVMWKVSDGIVSGGESQWQGRVSGGKESVVGESQ